MARRYSGKKGKSGSTKPSNLTKRSWVVYPAKEVEQLVVKIRKTGKDSSQIGSILRDNYGIPDVKVMTGKKITQILKENKLNKELPEDLIALIKKDINLVKHFEMYKKDLSVKRGLQITLSKIRRLTKYYKRTGLLAEDWNYDRSKAKLLME